MCTGVILQDVYRGDPAGCVQGVILQGVGCVQGVILQDVYRG